MANAPLVSVIVPVYNGEAFIRRCLGSLMQQDVQDMELIVVDDGSTDDTWALLEQLAQEDARIHPIHQENQGVSAARNTALDHCRGHYVRFADADDVVAPGSIAAMIRCMDENGAELVIGGYREITGPLSAPRSLAPDASRLTMEEFLPIFSRQSNSFYYGVLWNKLFLGDVIRQQRLRFPKGMKWGEDFHFVTDYLTYVRCIAYLPRSVYDYHRRMEGTVVRQFFDCVRHPLFNLKTRWRMYTNYRDLFIDLGAYPRYRDRLWQFLFRFTLHN